MRDSYQLVGHYVTEGVWWGVEGKMELKDRFLQPASTIIFGNRLISPIPQWAVRASLSKLSLLLRRFISPAIYAKIYNSAEYPVPLA